MEKAKSIFAKAFLVMMFVFGAGFAEAQAQNAVSGTIKDATGAPLPGVAVMVDGSTTGTVSDFDGKYQLNSVPSMGTLVFSFIGFETQTVPVAGQSTIDVVLQEESIDLNEIVAIGYGVQRKSDLTGSVASVKADDLKHRSTTDAAAALQGKAAGVQILNTSGKPGEGASIRVRGYSSNSSNIGPLLIVDGLQVSSIQYLDPELIESMEVLKDAASASIYGAEAGNGVVLITTKSGGKGQGKGQGTITYNGKFTMNSLGNVPELLNAAEFIEWQGLLQGADKVKADMETAKKDFGWDPNTDTDWLNEYFENSWTKQHSLSFQGGNERGSYFMNINYVDQQGIVKGEKDFYKRLTGQVNADHKIKDWLQVGTNNSIEKWQTGSVSEQNYGTAFDMLLTIDPLTPLYWTKKEQMLPEYRDKLEAVENGTSSLPYEFYGDENGYYATSYFNQRLAGGNPFSQRDRSLGKNSGVNINGTAFLNFTPFEWLTYTSRLGYRISYNNSSDFSTPYYLNSKTSGTTYSISGSSNNSLYYQWENFINFNKTFADVHNVAAMAGMSFRHNESNGVSANASGPDILRSYEPNYIYLNCVNGNADTSKGFSGMPGESASLSYFGRLTYSFDNRYSVQANFRADAFDSSKLSQENRWGKFFSVSGGWTLSNESFFKDNVSPSIVSFAKIRASWGQNGNVNVLNNYAYTASINTNGKWYQYDASNTATYGSMPNGLANPKLSWETSEQLDFGLDLRLLNDRLSLGLDYYVKETKDLLVTAPCLPESGVSTQTINAGNVLNSGLEVELGWKDSLGDFKYSISGNLATLKNEVSYLDPSIVRVQGNQPAGQNLEAWTYFEEGMPVWYIRGYKYAGRDKDGAPLFYAADGTTTLNPQEDDKDNIGCGIPAMTFGLTLNAEYKGIDLNIFGTGAAGNDIWYAMYRSEGYTNVAKHLLEEARKSGENDFKMVASNMKYWSSDAVIYDGSFFKIKQIQLGYTLPQSITQKAFIQNLRCYVSVDDFITITKYPGLDPETASLGHNGLGIDSGAYPSMRKLVFGVGITF